MYELRQAWSAGINTWRKSSEPQRCSEDEEKGMFVAQAEPATVVKDQHTRKE
jgi:hypothetical protein